MTTPRTDSTPTPRTILPSEADSGRRLPPTAHWSARILSRRIAPWLALVPILLAVTAIVLVGDGERRPQAGDVLPAGTQSAQAEELAAALPAEEASALVVFTAQEGELSPEQLSTLRELGAEAGAARDADPVVAEDGTAAIVEVPLSASGEEQQTAEIEDLRAELAGSIPDGVDEAVTGPAAIEADLEASFDGANTRLLIATVLVVAVLLVVTYRSPVLWAVPLLVIGVADRLASVVATQVMAALDIGFDTSTTAILSILVFGAGTDYALLLISRYRTQLERDRSRRAAMAVALRRTARAVLTSAVTVVVGVLTLLLSLTPNTRALGVASAIGIGVASLFVLLVLPAALVCFGRWIFWPRIPRHDTRGAGSRGEAGDSPSGPDHDSDLGTTLWGRVARLVARRPRTVVTASVVLVAVMASGTLGIGLGLDGSDALRDPPESVIADERLAESFPDGVSDPVQVLTRGSADDVARTAEDLDATESAEVAAQAGGVSQVDVVLSTPPGSDRTEDAVLELRDALDGYPSTVVSGTEAQAVDTTDSARRDLGVIAPILVGLVLLVLAGLLRSITAPLILVGTVVATYAAALGGAWWIFDLLGYDGLDTNVPIIAFVFLVALGIDYNIFLVTRAREEGASQGTRDGMLHALAATGGVITSAGILLAAVFTVLGQLPAVGLAQIGIVICLGVLLDTLVVRTLLVPAAALLLGDKFWWPGTGRLTTSEPTSEPTSVRRDREEVGAGTR